MSEKCTQNEREAAPPPKWGSFLKTPGRCLLCLCSRLGTILGTYCLCTCAALIRNLERRRAASSSSRICIYEQNDTKLETKLHFFSMNTTRGARSGERRGTPAAPLERMISSGVWRLASGGAG